MLVLKFVDDTKVFRKVTNDTDKQSLHDNLDQLDKWSEKWQMLFNFEKCKYMHIGHRNWYFSYESRLVACGLTTLETTTLRGDQIEVFK